MGLITVDRVLNSNFWLLFLRVKELLHPLPHSVVFLAVGTRIWFLYLRLVNRKHLKLGFQGRRRSGSHIAHWCWPTCQFLADCLELWPCLWWRVLHPWSFGWIHWRFVTTPPWVLATLTETHGWWSCTECLTVQWYLIPDTINFKFIILGLANNIEQIWYVVYLLSFSLCQKLFFYLNLLGGMMVYHNLWRVSHLSAVVAAVIASFTGISPARAIHLATILSAVGPWLFILHFVQHTLFIDV